MTLATRMIAGAALLSLVVPAGMAVASPQFLMDTIKAGLPAKNCQYCHTEATPTKEKFKPDALNDRGKFVLTDMQTRWRHAAEVTAASPSAWLAARDVLSADRPSTTRKSPVPS